MHLRRVNELLSEVLEAMGVPKGAQEPTIPITSKMKASLKRIAQKRDAKAAQRIADLFRFKYGQNYYQTFGAFKKAVPDMELRDFEALMQ